MELPLEKCNDCGQTRDCIYTVDGPLCFDCFIKWSDSKFAVNQQKE